MCVKSSQFMNAYVGQEFKLSGFPGCSGFLSALESCRAESTSDWTGMEISGWTSEPFLGKATLTILSTAPDAGPQNFWSPPVHSPQVIDITQGAAAENPVHRLSADLQRQLLTLREHNVGWAWEFLQRFPVRLLLLPSGPVLSGKAEDICKSLRRSLCWNSDSEQLLLGSGNQILK